MRPAVQKDIELVQPPPESISKIAFSPTQDILAVGSWDNNVSEHQITYIMLALPGDAYFETAARLPMIMRTWVYADLRFDSMMSTRKDNLSLKPCTTTTPQS
jgi:hypothetical protein